MLNWPKYLFLILLNLFFVKESFGQNLGVKIESGPDLIQAEGQFTVTVTITGGTQYNVGDFPEIKGLKKGNRSIKHGQILINKKKEEQHTISQVYTTEGSGKILIPSFEIEVNQKNVKVDGKTIEVMKNPTVEKNIEIEEVDFVVEVSKKEIYVGEGVKVNIGFYHSDKTTTQWQFPTNIGQQVEDFARKIKPKDCLESRLNISNLVAKKITVKGESYTVYNLFEAVYYPLNNKNFTIPALTIIMQKQKGGNYTDMTLKSKNHTIAVKELPEHPLKEKVAVGQLRLSEDLKSQKQQYTGNSFEYKLSIEGEANFSSVNLNKVENTRQFDFFESNNKTNQTNGNENGSKAFVYKIVPKEAGEFDFGNYFTYIYFNSEKEKYDTLKSVKKISVSGAAMAGNKELKNDIYSDIENLRTDQKSYNLKNIAKILANFVVGFMILVYFYIIKSKNKGE